MDAINQIWTAQGYATGTAPNYAYTLVNPVSIAISDSSDNVTDQIQAIRASTTGPLLPTDSFPQSTWSRWTHSLWSDNNQLTAGRVYFAIPPSGDGVKGVNYNERTSGFDFIGRQNTSVSGGGTGAVRNPLIDNTWFDPANNILMTLLAGSRAFTKSVFDALNRQTIEYVGFYSGGATPTYAQAAHISGATIVEQTETAWDDASNDIQTTTRRRFHNATGLEVVRLLAAAAGAGANRGPELSRVPLRATTRSRSRETSGRIRDAPARTEAQNSHESGYERLPMNILQYNGELLSAPPARHGAASCHEGLSLWRQNRSVGRSGEMLRPAA